MKKLIVILMLAMSAPLMAASSPTPTPTPTAEQAEVKAAMAGLVTEITQTLRDAKSFTIEQAPDLFKQYLAWEYFKDIGWAIFTGLLTILMIGLSALMVKEGEEGAWFFVLSAMIAAAIMFGYLIDMHKINVAPKVYLLEYARDLIK